MDYFKHYSKLIEKAQNRTTEEYTEIHHIIPKCMGCTDDKNNLVNLFPEEHYVAHQLLAKMYPENYKLVYAANMMCVNRPNNKLYGWLRRKLSSHMKKNNPNLNGVSRKNYNQKNGSPNKGFQHTSENKKRFSDQKKGELNPNKNGNARKTKTMLIDEKTNEIIYFSSLKEAEQKLNANHSSVCYNRKRNKPYRGYYWYVGNEILGLKKI